MDLDTTHPADRRSIVVHRAGAGPAGGGAAGLGTAGAAG